MFRPLRRSEKQLSVEETLDLLIRGREGILGTFGDDGYPYTVVVNYVYYQNKVYIHCANEGHKLDNIRYHENISFSVYDHVEIVGDELNTLYQSLTLFGNAKVMDATHDVLLALIQKYASMPLKRANDMIDKEINITTMIEITIEHLTGKFGK